MPRAPVEEPMKLPIGLEFRPNQSEQTWVLVEGVTDTGIPPDWRFPLKHIHRIRLVRKPLTAPARGNASP